MKKIIKRFRDLKWWEKPFAIVGLLIVIAAAAFFSPIIILVLCGRGAWQVLCEEDDYTSY